MKAKRETMPTVNVVSEVARAQDIIARSIVIGVGATVIMDLWAAFLRRCFHVSSLDYALLGRWLGHVARGRFRHESIGQATPIQHERVIGWIAHYTIGIVFAGLLVLTAGAQWVKQPTLLPPLLLSSITLIAPFFVMQPAMGAGIAASRTPRPGLARLRSVATHTVYGLGLYASAWVWTTLAR